MKNGVIGIVFDSTRTKVLLIQRRDVPIWVIPGGGIDEGETPAQAVVREVFEETGLTVKLLRQVAEYQPINWFTRTTYFFECQAIGGDLSAGAESRQVGFYPLSALPSPIFPYHSEWIADALLQTAMIRRPMSRGTFRRVIATYALRPLITLRYLCARMGFPINS